MTKGKDRFRKMFIDNYKKGCLKHRPTVTFIAY